MRVQTLSSVTAIVLTIAASSWAAPARPLASQSGAGVAAPQTGIQVAQKKDNGPSKPEGGGGAGPKAGGGGGAKVGGGAGAKAGGGGGAKSDIVRSQSGPARGGNVQTSNRRDSALQSEAKVRSGGRMYSTHVVHRSGGVLRSSHVVRTHRVFVRDRHFRRHHRFVRSRIFVSSVVVHGGTCHRHYWHGRILRHAHRGGWHWHRHGHWRYAGRCR